MSIANFGRRIKRDTARVSLETARTSAVGHDVLCDRSDADRIARLEALHDRVIDLQIHLEDQTQAVLVSIRAIQATKTAIHRAVQELSAYAEACADDRRDEDPPARYGGGELRA